MKKTMLILCAVTSAITFTLIACSSADTKTAGTAVISKDSLIKRGDYLVNAVGCDDCHSTKTFGPNGPVLDMEHRFGGHLATQPIGKVDLNVLKTGWLQFSPDLTTFVGPWGISYAANISSDETGIGSWTEEQFITALRKGKQKGMMQSRTLLPPMPWENYGKFSDMDLKAIFAYLKTTKPVSNVVPPPTPLNEIK